MPYTKTTWTNGSTAVSQTNMNNLETQYDEATQSLERDLLTAFVYTGLVATRHNAYSAAVLADAPIRYYRLDETSGTTVYDLGSSPQNGTTHGSPTQGVTGLLAGDPDTCYTFASASSQYISASGTGLPTGAGSFTLEAWVKFAAFPAANAYIGSWGNATTANLNVQMWIDNAGMAHFGTTGTAIASGALSTGTPHHIVGTYDGANLRLYVDGTLVAGPTAATLNIPSGPSFAWGAAAWSLAGTYFNGQIDEGAVYSSALSSTRISAHYTAGTTATTQLDVTSGTAFLTQTDSTQRRRALTASTQTTSTINTTYYLYLQPDGTWYWSTTNSPAANSLAIATVTTDSSGNVKLVTDQRTTNATFLSGSAGVPGVPQIVARAIDVNVAVTTVVTLITLTIAKGLYRFSGSMFNAGTGGSAQPNLKFQAPGGHANYTWSAHAALWTDAAVTSMDGTHALGGSNDWAILPETAYLGAGTLTVTYQNTVGSPNDNVTVVVERLA